VQNAKHLFEVEGDAEFATDQVEDHALGVDEHDSAALARAAISAEARSQLPALVRDQRETKPAQPAILLFF